MFMKVVPHLVAKYIDKAKPNIFRLVLLLPPMICSDTTDIYTIVYIAPNLINIKLRPLGSGICSHFKVQKE